MASNQGASCSKGEFLVMLNVDTEVQPGWLPPLLAAFNDPIVAMAGPHHHPPRRLSANVRYSRLARCRECRRRGAQGRRADRDVDGVTGACMVIRHSVFDALGRFDTRFVNGYEDVSMCLSVREAGHRIRYVSESLVMHHESAAGGEDRWRHVDHNIQTMNEIWGNR